MQDTDVYPCAEQYCRDTIYRPFLNNNLAKLRKLLGVERLKELSSNVTNYWIRLSNHYHSPFTDFKHIEPFLKLHPPQILDFIHEGFTFQYQSDKAKIIPFLGLVPSTSAGKFISMVSSNNKILIVVKSQFVVRKCFQLNQLVNLLGDTS